MVGDEHNEHVPPVTNQLDGDKNTNQKKRRMLLRKRGRKHQVCGRILMKLK